MRYSNFKKIEKLQMFDLSFSLVEVTLVMMDHKITEIFQLIYNTLIRLTGFKTIIAWGSKGLSTESIKTLTTPGTIVAPKPKWIHNSKEA